MTDRRYGNPNRYGNGRLYGTSDAPIVSNRWRWGVDVGWSTKYSGTNEADYMTALYIFRGRRSYLNPNGQGFAPVETGRARITLDNSNGRYDSFNTSSPLYPNVAPGKDVRVRVRDLDTGTSYDVFTGVVLDIETIGYGADAKVTLVCEDYWYYLRNQIVYFNIYNSGYFGSGVNNYAISALIAFILNANANLVTNPFVWVYGTSLETSTDTISYWWSSNNVNMADMLLDLAQSFFGKFFIAADGTATYYARSSTRTSVQTISQSILLKDIGNPQPWINQRNSLRIKVRPRALAANQTIWTLAVPIQVLEGESIGLNFVFTYSGNIVPAIDTLSNPGDYHMNTASDESGTDLLSFFLVDKKSYGDTGAMTITNNSSSDGYITKLEWFGVPIYEANELDISYPPAIPPQTRELFIESIWHQKVSTAISLVNTYGPQISALRQFPVIQFDTRPQGFVPDLFDIETVSLAALGISNTDFEVGGIEIETKNETCQAFIIRHFLEPHLTA